MNTDINIIVIRIFALLNSFGMIQLNPETVF